MSSLFEGVMRGANEALEYARGNLQDVRVDIVHKQYKLIGGDGKPYLSETPGLLGGNSRAKIYGRLDCRTANRYVSQGTYQKHRVFFANEQDAISAGYRPCGHCMPEEYKAWKQRGLNNT